MKIDNSIHYGLNKYYAKTFGVPAAMILNRMAWSYNEHIENEDQDYFIDNQWWMKNTFKSLTNHFEGIFSEKTIKRAVKSFEDAGVLISRKLSQDRWNHEKWYAINGAVLQKVTEPIGSKCPDEEGVKMSPSSSLNSLPNSLNIYMKSPRQIVLYPETHVMSAVFDNLRMVSIVKTKFKLAEYEKWLTNHMETKSLSIDDLVVASHEWQEYHNDRTEKPKSPKGSFTTWLNNFVERRSKQQKRRGSNQGWQRPVSQVDLDYEKDNGPIVQTDWVDHNWDGSKTELT